MYQVAMLKPYSVLLSLYYKEKPEFVIESLDSILKQSVRPEQIVVVKDGPLTAALEEVIGQYHTQQPDLFTIVSLPENKGLANALNHGLKYCRNEIVARMDADDIALPDRFELQLKYMDEKGLDVISAYLKEFNEVPGDIERVRALPEHHDQIVKFSHYRNPFNHPCMMYKRSVIEACGAYQEVPLFEDYFLWLTVLKNKHRSGNYPGVLLYFRIGNGMVKRRHGIGYLKKELYFYRLVFKNRLLPVPVILVAAIARMPLRILPLHILDTIYKNFIRK